MGWLNNDRRIIRLFKKYLSGASISEPEWERNKIVPPPWPAKCMRTDTASDNDETIEVQVFHHKGQRKHGEVARDYIESALSESFGGWYDNNVVLCDKPVPKDIHTQDEAIEWRKDQGITRVKDCNIFVIQARQALGGGNTAIATSDGLQYLHGDCPRTYGSNDAHNTIHVILHEVGHCLGLPHAHETEWLNGSYKGLMTPMSGSYMGDGTRLHVFHPDDVTRDRLDIK